MAIIFRDKSLKVDAGSKVFDIKTDSMKKALSNISTKKVTIDLYNDYAKLLGKNSTQLIKINETNEKIKFITPALLLKGRDYIKVPVPPDKFIRGVNWLYKAGTLKHSKAYIELNEGKLVMHDEDMVGKKGREVFDEAKAVLNNIADASSFKVKIRLEYLNVVSNILNATKFADIRYLEMKVINSESPIVLNGYFEVIEKDKLNKDKTINNKYKFDTIIAPLVEE